MPPSGERPTLIRGARLADGSAVDVSIADGLVVDVATAGTAPVPTDSSSVLDLDGHLLLAATADPHAHLDKARSWDAITPPMGDLRAAIASWRAYADHMSTDDIVARAHDQALRNLRHGTTAIRTHVDVLRGPQPLRGIHALVEVRDMLRDVMDIEIIALASDDVPTAVIETALDAGADGVGGAAHLAPEPLTELDRFVEIAARRDCVLDMHTDESLDEAVTLGALAERTHGWTRNVSAGHCVRLGTLEPAHRDELIAAVVRSRIGIIANPITNLYLQGWNHEVATPRGLTAARQLLDAGARFAAGADNVRDPFNPLGRSDALETAMLLVVAAHLDVEEAFTAVSHGAREVMALPPAGPTPGAAADLLAVKAHSLIEAVAEAPADRVVIHHGSVVSRSTTSVTYPSLTPSPETAR
ncbi:amidohydrolase family protein [Demequina aestuarii]|uniref:amidohydrolase family protein n=1 Tax=Demequina aestuarii TaxID=327095 RepID=UPI000784BDC5|nr:amidohydrolase family protein [Demequina aestuarii]